LTRTNFFHIFFCRQIGLSPYSSACRPFHPILLSNKRRHKRYSVGER
jgi:hypothetical protein